MRRIFHKDDVESAFAKDGFVVVRNFLNNEEITALKALYSSKDQSEKKGFHRSLDAPDADNKRFLAENIRSVFMPKLKQLLIDYKYLLASFMVKAPETNSDFELHQNWNFVDESKFQSLVCRCPLVDTDEKNGTMFVVKGSNRLFPTFRGGPHMPSAFDDCLPYIKKHYMEAIALKAGDAIILDDALLHYTSANPGSSERIAIALVSIPEEANPIYYYYEQQEAKLYCYHIDDDFYNTFNNRYPMGERPQDIPVETSISYRVEKISAFQYEKAIQKSLWKGCIQYLKNTLSHA